MKIGDWVFVKSGCIPEELKDSDWVSVATPGIIQSPTQDSKIYDWVVWFEGERRFRFKESELRKRGFLE